MSKSERWLAKPTNSFEEAFPNVQDISFQIDPDPYKQFAQAHPVNITRASPKSFVRCPNERCRRGGFDFGEFLLNHTYTGSGTTEIDNKYPCHGDEGSPAGKKKGATCGNAFHVKGPHRVQVKCLPSPSQALEANGELPHLFARELASFSD